MKKNKFILILNILIYFLFFVLLLKTSLSYLDTDFGWHLKVGEEISLNKGVPHINHYNYVFSEHENFWTDHEWLSNLLVFFLYNNFSYLILASFFVLIFLFTLFLLNNFIIKNVTKAPASSLLVLTLELLLLKGILPHSGVRVQEFSWLFLLLFLIIIYTFEKKSLLNKRNNWKVLIWTIPLLGLWANLHASFLLGIALLFFYLAIKIVERLISNYKNKLTKIITKIFNFDNTLKNKNLLIFGAISLLASLATLVNPYGLKLFNFLFVYGHNTAYLKIISEWFSIFKYPIIYWQLLYLGITIALWLVFFITKEKNNHYKILTPWNVALNLLFLVLAIKSRRHFPLFFIVSFPSLIDIIFTEFKKLTTIKAPTKRNSDILLKLFLIFTIITTTISLSLKINFTKDPFSNFCHKYPCSAVNFLKNNNDNFKDHNIFNSYNWGGYLLWTYPEKKIFIDGRLPQKSIKDHSYVEEYLLFFNEDEIEKKIKEYDVKLILLPKDKPIKLNWLDKNIFNFNEDFLNNNVNNLIDFLKKSPHWKNIYEDNTSLIYEKIS